MWVTMRYSPARPRPIVAAQARGERIRPDHREAGWLGWARAFVSTAVSPSYSQVSQVPPAGSLIWRNAYQLLTAGEAQIRAILSRSELAMTLTDESAMAVAASTGESSMPKNGYSTPAATGTPAAL